LGPAHEPVHRHDKGDRRKLLRRRGPRQWLASNVFAIAGQYTDSTGHAAYASTFAGALVDSHAYPKTGNCTVPNEVDKGPYAACLFDKQLQEELSSFIAENSLPKGPTQLYFVLLPHNVATCLPEVLGGKQVCSNNFYCAYHSYISPGTANEIIYADIPFSLLDSSFAKGCQSDGHAEVQLPNGDKGTSDAETRFADVALKYLSHEYIEAATDPLVNFETAWVDEEGLEIADKCNGIPFEEEEEGEPGFDKHAFTPTLGGSAASGTLFNQAIDTGHYYLQSEWDNAGEACLMKPLPLGAVAIGVGAATAGLPVSFTSSAADPYGAYEPSWDFGDGGTATGPSPSHTYATAGEYTVTMTPKDALTGSTASAIDTTVTVASPPPPAGPLPVVPPRVVPPPVITTNPVATTGSTATSSSVATTQPVSPSSAFVAQAGGFNAATGAITLKATFADPGTLSWGATFANGKFGAFASSAKCKKGQLRLRGRCLPARITFAKGSRALAAAAGSVAITLKPSPSALKALKAALKQRKGVPVSIVLSFQSSRGGAPVSHAQTVTVKLKK
jgi:PKD repeat protein